MGNNFIANTALSNLRVISFQGINIYTCHQQIQELLKKNLGDKHTQLFAEPVKDDRDGSIDWYTDVSGKAKRLDSFPEDQQSVYKDTFYKLISDIKGLANKIVSESGDNSVKGNILLKALSWPASPNIEQNIYIINDQPLLVCWGFQDSSGKTVNSENIDRDGVKKTKSTPIPPKETVIQPTTVQEIKPKTNHNWLLYLLPLLLLLLLFLLWRFIIPRYPEFFENSNFGCTRVQNYLNDSGFGCSKKIPLPSLDIDNLRNYFGGIDIDLSNLNDPSLPFGGGKIIIKNSLVDDANIPIDLVLSGSIDDVLKNKLHGSAIGGDQTCDGTGNLNLSPDGILSLDFNLGLTCPNQNHFKPFKIYCEKGLTNCKIETSNGQNWPINTIFELGAKNTSNEEMRIPDSDTLDFLEGAWRCDTGIHALDNGEPVVLEFSFDRNGTGSSWIKRNSGQISKADVTATIKDKTLTVKTGNYNLDSGQKAFGSQTIICKIIDKRSLCSGINDNGMPWFFDKAGVPFIKVR